MSLENSLSPTRLEQAAEWRRREADGLSDDEAHSLSAWLEDADNASAFDKADRVWAAFDGADDADLAMLRGRVRRRVQARKGRSAYRWIGAAAAVLVAAVVGFGAYQMRPVGQVFIASAEAPRELVLEDGSVVILDAGARLRTHFDKDSRDLELSQGQARFDVAHDPGRPFRVDVGSGVVQAVGTLFNIRRDGDGAVVTLVRGAIDVFEESPKAGETAKRLTAGQQIRLVRPTSPEAKTVAGAVSAVDTETATVWKSRMTFDDIPLAEAARRFSRTSDRPVVLSGPGIGDLRVSGAFDYGDAEGFGKAVSRLFDLKMSERPDAIVLQASE